MNVLLQSPNTFKMITLPSPFMGASPSVVQHLLECHPPTFPSDASWDMLCRIPERSILTFTRPPLAERSTLRKAALGRARQKLAESEATVEERLELLERSQKVLEQSQKVLKQKIHKVDSLFQRDVDRQIHVLRFETYTRLLQVLNDDLMSKLSADVKSQMKKSRLDYIISILEGVYPQGTSEPSARDQLLDLAGEPFLPTSTNPTKRMKLAQEALDKMPEERLRLAVQLYHIIHELRDGDSQLFRTTRNRLQHPRPSILVAQLALVALAESNIPFKFDSSTANILINEEAKKDTGDTHSSLFGKTDDPGTAELFEHL